MATRTVDRLIDRQRENEFRLRVIGSGALFMQPRRRLEASYRMLVS